MAKRRGSLDKKNEAVREIEDLIDGWAMSMDDDSFIEALEEMESRARIALDARKEELGRE